MNPHRLLAIAALVLSPLVARAADVPVSYTVDEKALRAAVSGTDLMFELYTDSACAALTHTDIVPIDDVTFISRLALLRPAGGVKPPKTAELRHTLTGVTPATALYLDVTGTGATPIGGACQAQASTVAGPGPPGGAIVKDANGVVAGR